MSQPATQSNQEFGKWRSMLWPIHNFELKKIIPMLLLFFFLNFNYTILRDTKDSLVVTAANSGAETLPFLKVWAVLPAAILFMIFYSKLSNILSKKALFYASLVPFMLFFAIFPTILYPMRESLHPNELADRLQALLPTGLFGLVAVMRNWTYSLFYVMAELWGSVGISLLFWGFANDTTRVSESKRFYAMFGIGANLAMLVSGPLIKYFSREGMNMPADMRWGWTLDRLCGMVLIAGFLAAAVYWWMTKYVLTDPRFIPTEVKKKKEKTKMSLGESFKFLLRSKYILCLAVIVIAYGVCINLVEVTWKGQLKLQYTTPNEYSEFMGTYSTILGAVTIVMMLFIGGNMLRRFGWTMTALTTPVVLLATGVIFFAFVIFKDSLSALTALFHMTPLFIAVIVGTIQNVMSKASKYSLFDPTKEIAYIPLDQESKVKGKAAIDVVGARLGKSGGALIQQGLFLFGTLAVMTPYIAAILFVIIGAWIAASSSLGKQFNELSAQKDAEAAAEKEPLLTT